jgi:hypothetical protein
MKSPLKQKSKQVALSLPLDLLDQVTEDACQHGKSRQSIIEGALRYFFNFKPIERVLAYRNIPNKQAGRPL